MPEGQFALNESGNGFEELNKFWAELDDIEARMEEFSRYSLEFLSEPNERVLEKIRAFEPSVSVIGQIKAGKSTLLNAIIGAKDLLPSDVNPWTSVITGLHLNSRNRPINTRALFRFFDQLEWDRLVATGGRLGEMAERAGFEKEVEAVRSQVTEMRQHSEARHGDDIANLLGRSHTFPELKKDIIDRYICYGDPDELGEGANEGVFADLTKSADLYIDIEDLPSRLCLRDTPGVNDTFMMREQITLNAISDSRVCVVVLSAHQALSTMDIALLRIICSVDAREVLIFVNRIDELADPTTELEAIRNSIEETLKRQGLAEDVDILFGSGHWASCAHHGVDQMLPAARRSLQKMYPDADFDDSAALSATAMAASGVPTLLRAIAERIVRGQGLAFLNDIKDEITSIVEMSDTVETIVEQPVASSSKITITSQDLSQRLEEIRTRSLAQFDQRSSKLRDDLQMRLERAQSAFTNSAIDVLKSHISTFGETGAWEHDPASLRMMMKTAFTSSCSQLRREGAGAFSVILKDVQDLQQRDLFAYSEGGAIEFPEQPQHSAPTVLGRTLSLDLNRTWWSKFWKFGGTKKAEKRYRDLIIAETTPLIEDLLSDHFDQAVSRTRAIVEHFVSDQENFCKAIWERAEQKGQICAPVHEQRGSIPA